MNTPSASPRATEEGTARFRDRNVSRPGHFRRTQGLWLSSIGMSTSLVQADSETDAHYTAPLVRAIELGSNVVDTTVNYRHQRSERAIGAALQRLFKARKIRRDEIVVIAKGGYLPPDGQSPADRARYIRETFVETGLTTSREIIDGNCLAPGFLRAMIDQARRNLAVDCLDIFYLHNLEIHLDGLDRAQFRERLYDAFGALEEAVDKGSIHYYGLATWDGLRVAPAHAHYLSLADVMTVARKARGVKHHCRFVQLPLNLTMSEAVTMHQQVVNHETMTALEAAARLGLAVMTNASLMHGQLVGCLPAEVKQKFNGLTADAQRCLQFVRSTPGVTTALAGMSRVAHVEENLATASIAPLTAEEYQALFAQST
jgi:aryl-alcohol dehydrogenase-like predicted oxidoreductase